MPTPAKLQIKSKKPVLPKSPCCCPMESLLRLISGQWTSYILWVLHQNGMTRFGELKRQVGGISAKVLTERLRMLEEARILVRHYEPTVPPQVSYALTPNGEELMGVFENLSQLAKKWAK